MNIKSARYRLPGVAVTLAMDRKATSRELASRLISDLYGQVLSQDEFARGFDTLLSELGDLTLDTPEAPQVPVYANMTFKLLCENFFLYRWKDDG